MYSLLLASCSYEESKKYSNKLVVASDGTKKNQEEVLLNIVTDNPDEVLKGGLGSAKCLSSYVKPSFCPKEYYGNVFHMVPLEDFKGVEESEGVVCLVVLPEGYSDMRKVESICLNSEGYYDVEHKVRVIGGNLLEIPDVYIGRYDKGKEKMSSVYNGTYDIFREVLLSDINVREVFSKVSKKSSSSKNISSRRLSPKSRVKSSLDSLFGGVEEDF